MSGRFLRIAGTLIVLMLVTGCWGRSKPLPRASSAPPPPASTEDRIAAAEQAGRINAATALLFRVYAAYGDAALPAEFRAPEMGVSTISALQMAAAQLGSMPADVASRMAPFLRPAGFDEGWWELRHKSATSSPALAISSPFSCGTIDPAVWSYVDAVDSVRVWAPRADAKLTAAATLIRDELDRYIYGKVTGYLGKEPRPDSGPCSAGSDRLDIWVVDTLGGVAGITKPFVARSQCDEMPVSIEIATDVAKTREDLFSTVAHELSHAVISARPLHESCADYVWLDEATGSWIEQLTYPDANGERTFGCCLLLTQPGYSLNLSGWTAHEYSVYAFLMYLYETLDQAVVRRIWDKAASASSIEAVDQAVGGLHTVWPGFARARWNQPPVMSFQTWDELDVKPYLRTDRKVPLNARSTMPLPTSIEHLASDYHRFTFTDPTVGWGAVVQNAVSDQADAATHVFVKAAGVWREESLTGVPAKLYCDAGLEELVVAVSNSSLERRLTTSGLAVSVDRCSAALPVAIHVDPPWTIGGAEMNFRVELNRVNDDGWLQIALTSENRAVAVPPVIVVASGQREASFIATTRPVAVETYGSIFASNPAVPASSTANVFVTVNPPCPVLLGLPGRVRGGESFRGSVVLNGSAPPGGLTVTADAEPRLLIVPATITVPEGQTSVTFEGQGGDPCGTSSCEETATMTIRANGCVPAAHTKVFD